MSATIFVVTSTKEQQSVMAYLREKLKLDYHNDLSVTVVQSALTRVDVWHTVKGSKNLAASYVVLFVPVTMSLDSLLGFPQNTNININLLLQKLDNMKKDAVQFVNARKAKTFVKNSQKEALSRAAKSLFE